MRKLEKDYYLILGVSENEELEVIRSAFRRLAKRHHPDRAGPEATRAFQEIAEAYEVLSDATRRRRYDEARRRAAYARALEEALLATPPDKGGRSRADRAQAAATRTAALRAVLRTLADQLGASSPLIHRLMARGQAWTDGLFERLLTAPSPMMAVTSGTVAVEVVLSAEEAQRGGVAPIAITTMDACPACAGTRSRGCSVCSGLGRVERERWLHVWVPRRVADGAVIETELPGVGTVRVVVRIER